LWMPPAQPPPAPDPVVESYVPPRIPVPPGRRGVVVDLSGAPASFVDVFLTELDPQWNRIYPAQRTNFEGHFPLTVPPGRYRVQGLFIDHVIVIPETEPHPDIQVRVVPQPLLRFLSTVR